MTCALNVGRKSKTKAVPFGTEDGGKPPRKRAQVCMSYCFPRGLIPAHCENLGAPFFKYCFAWSVSVS